VRDWGRFGPPTRASRISAAGHTRCVTSARRCEDATTTHGSTTHKESILPPASRRRKAPFCSAFLHFQLKWQSSYAGLVRRLELDLPELLSFFRFPPHLWRKLRTTNAIKRCFVEVRRRARPMVGFVNVESVHRIIFPILNSLKE
jgi:transposase-like protein